MPRSAWPVKPSKPLTPAPTCSCISRAASRITPSTVPVQECASWPIAPNPNYTFNPDVFPESAEARGLKTRLILPPGPNNPVGGLDQPGPPELRHPRHSQSGASGPDRIARLLPAGKLECRLPPPAGLGRNAGVGGALTPPGAPGGKRGWFFARLAAAELDARTLRIRRALNLSRRMFAQLFH